MNQNIADAIAAAWNIQVGQKVYPLRFGTSDIEGILLALKEAGFFIVPRILTPEMKKVCHNAGWHGNIDGDHPAEEEQGQTLWETLIDAFSP